LTSKANSKTTAFRRQLRWLMRATFSAKKVTKNASAGVGARLRRVPCGARARRGEKNSLRSNTFSPDCHHKRRLPLCSPAPPRLIKVKIKFKDKP